jgi:Fe-S cluster biogenesis protein NfuA
MSLGRNIDRAALQARLADVNALLRAHAGGVELLNIGSDGVVAVRFAGKCTGCELKPLTLAGTVRPGLLAVDGVTEVVAEGARISEEAAQRVAAALGGDAGRRRWLQQVHEQRLPQE